jgi:ribosomal protein S18 acetylase RimI-like enzyme
MPSADEARLDDPVYAALSGTQARFAQISGRALRYPADVAPFLALPSEPSLEDWRDATHLVPPGDYVGIMHAGAEAPDPWKVVGEFDVVQMIGEDTTGAADPEAVSLNADDVAEMLDLVSETKPGPFLARTIELGEYVGIRRDGQLVAMAGERLHFDGWMEISAVCTAPTYRGHGMASGLVRTLLAGIQHRSERAFLHATTNNMNRRQARARAVPW